jgi:hypothetical protein
MNVLARAINILTYRQPKETQILLKQLPARKANNLTAICEQIV